MPELRQLHELTGQVRAPSLSSLTAVTERRSRRAAAGLATGVAASVVLAATVGAAVMGERDSTSGPVGPGPSPAVTFPVLSPQQIRDHPDAKSSGEGDFRATASGATARIWSVCLDECTRASAHLPGELQTVLEVSSDDFATGSLYALDQSENISHAVDDWYLLDASDGPTLVDTQGRRRVLRYGAAVSIAEVAGPLVYSRQGLASLDRRAGVLHSLERRSGDWDWQGASDTWFWGTAWLVEDTTVTRQAALWQESDGTFAVKVLPIGDSDGSSGMLRARTPGTIAVVEHFASPRLAHISTDYGVTWQVRQVPADVESGGNLPEDWSTWPPG